MIKKVVAAAALGALQGICCNAFAGSAEIWTTDSNGNLVIIKNPKGPVDGSYMYTDPMHDAVGGGYYWASAREGALKLLVTGYDFNQQFSSTGGAGVQAFAFEKNLVVDSPLHDNEYGYIRVSIDFNWTSSYDIDHGEVRYDVDAFAGVNGNYVQSGFIVSQSEDHCNLVYNCQPYSGGPALQLLNATNADLTSTRATANLQIIYGQPFDLTMSADARIETFSGPHGGSSGTLDASHSIYWGGISAAYDSDGNPVNDFTVTSDSGLDYTKSFKPLASAVPEPETYALLLAGFAGLGLYASRRQ